MQELSIVQGRQREVAGQLETADSQAKQLDVLARQLEERRHQLAFAEKRMAAFEGASARSGRAAAEVEGRIQDLTKRHEALPRPAQGGARRAGFERAEQGRFRSSAAHRADVLSLRAQVDDSLGEYAQHRGADRGDQRPPPDGRRGSAEGEPDYVDARRPSSLETVGTQRCRRSSITRSNILRGWKGLSSRPTGP